MKFESIAIIVIAIVMFVIFMRANKPNYAIGTLPLGLVPLANLAKAPVGIWLSNYLPFTSMQCAVGLLVFVLAVSCLILGIVAMSIRPKRSRATFILACGGFNIAITLVFISNFISP